MLCQFLLFIMTPVFFGVFRDIYKLICVSICYDNCIILPGPELHYAYQNLMLIVVFRPGPQLHYAHQNVMLIVLFSLVHKYIITFKMLC